MNEGRCSATLEIPPERWPGPVLLRITSGTQVVERLLVPGADLRIGAAPHCDIVLPDAAVSALHCVVSHACGSIEVVDCGSKNGISVAGLRVGSLRLYPGMCFEVGHSRIEIGELEADAEDGRRRTAPLPGLIGRSAPMQALSAAVRRAAPLRLPVLVRGESGSGKELVARALHDLGSRPDGPFVAINAATLTRELAESELFGHVRGSFTGAARDRRGAFREASGGTLFLDEIAALPIDVQAKLLRVVEDGSVRPLGSERPVFVDTRLVAATCESLEEMVEQGRFRRDLYERLSALRVRVPPLRERRSDIPELADHLLSSSEVGARSLSKSALGALRTLPYSGNVRELRNILVQAALKTEDVIEAAHVSLVLRERAPGAQRRLTPREALRMLELAGGNVSRAARLASMPRSSLRDLLQAAASEATDDAHSLISRRHHRRHADDARPGRTRTLHLFAGEPVDHRVRHGPYDADPE